PDARVDLGGVDTRVPKQRADLLEVMMLFEDFHGDTMAEVMGLELREADHPAVDLAEPPDVLAGHWRAGRADRAPPPGRPEERCVGPDLLDLFDENSLNVRLQKLRDHRGERNVARLAAFNADAPETVGSIEVPEA